MDVLSLDKVLEVFNVPINEEQAWAVCYQCAKWLEADWEQSGEGGCFRLEGLKSVLLHRDGAVSCGTTKSERVHSQFELIQSLGMLVYQALDYGLSEGEEHKLSPALERLIEDMTVSNEAAQDKDTSSDMDGDEGIENDSDEEEDTAAVVHVTFDDVIQKCESHLVVSSEAVSHYRAVCRALVAEAQELFTFLEKVTPEQTREAMRDEADGFEIDLCRADWARLWISLMKELRHGVKLKKVEHGMEPPIEFALTPYEILMEDIKSRRYTLNKVMVNGSYPPRVKADAHSLILEFIRSRPPLHPVKDRVLKSPPPQDTNPHEQLLQAIRSEPRLRPVSPGTYVETSRTRMDEGDATPNTMRRLIKPDISLIKFTISDEEESEIEDLEEDSEDERNKVTPSPLSPLTPLSPHSPWQQSDDEDLSDDDLDDAELAEIQAVLDDDDESLPNFTPYRRHSVDICVKPIPQKPIGNPLECLSLTVEEVMHIRGVLTKAELECQMMDAELRDLLTRGKVCFTCKTTRFSIFGPWSTKCKFCKRNVCSKCYSKMQIPAEHFEHIPVYTLSPSPLSPKTSKDIYNVFENTGSAPSSPILDRHNSPPSSSLVSMDTNGNGNKKRPRPPMQRSMTVARPPGPTPPALNGPVMAVCKDCKLMICHVIRASRVSLSKSGFADMADFSAQKPSRKFHLDLKPVYK